MVDVDDTSEPMTPQQKKVAVIGGICMAVGVLSFISLFIYINAKPSKPIEPPARATLPASTAVTWSEVHAKFPRKDMTLEEVDALWAPYRNRCVQWTGTVIRWEAEDDDAMTFQWFHVYLKMEPGLRDEDLGVSLHPSDEAQVKTLKPGQTITVKGLLSPPVLNTPPLWLTSAEIVSTQPTTGATPAP